MSNDKGPERARSKLDALISHSNLAALIAEMETAQPKQKETFSPKEAIDQYRDVFKSYLEKGYSLQDIAELFSKHGCEVTRQSLGQHMSGKKQAATTSRSAKSSRSKAPGKERKPKVQPGPEAVGTQPTTDPTARMSNPTGDRPTEVRDGVGQGTVEQWEGAAPVQTFQRTEVAKPQVDKVITMKDL